MKTSVLLIGLFLANLWHRIHADGFTATLGHIKPQASPETQEQAVQDLIKRILPDKAIWFAISVDPNFVDNESRELFQIVKTPDKTVHITGTTGVVAATAFHYYLKYFCNSHISWETSQLVTIPEELPDVNLTMPLNDRFRYYQNVCTSSYSFVWWNWQQWEKHIDWMALNSLNLVLAFNGQEAIWERVYARFNLTREEIDEHLTGPAFLAWLRMGNIRGWGGPLSQAWHARSLVLQKQVLQRMRDFGMIPVLPGFAGHLPRAFKRLYPDADMAAVGEWNGFNATFCCPYFLNPTEELFNEIGRAFMEEQIAEFGTDHVYNCDSFNENTPSTDDLTYLANVGRSIYKAMTDVDPEAIWLMQNWLFVHDFLYWTRNRAKALITSVPKGKMIVLDLQSEQFPQYDRLNQYFGQPYIWCMLHNFGGTLGMFGSSSIINEAPILARTRENSTMIGTGLTPEGINQNYVMYDLMSEAAWRSEPANLTEWMENYATRRYGGNNVNASSAWRTLQKTIYNYAGLVKMRGKYVINRSPNLKIQTWSWYPTAELISIWNELLAAAEELGENSGFQHDLVDVTRQFLQVNGDFYYTGIIRAYNEKDIETFQRKADVFLSIFPDLESILSTNEAFLLGRWLKSAREAADNPQDEQLFEYNARNQITLWGPQGEIMDYASKQWAGVVSNFFAPRWKIFIDYLNDTLINQQPFNQSYIKNRIFQEAEEPFTFDRTEFPSEPLGNAVEVARAIRSKWLPSYPEDNQIPTLV